MSREARRERRDIPSADARGTVLAVLFDLDGTLWRSVGAPNWDKITELQAEEVTGGLTRLGLRNHDVHNFVRSFWQDYEATYPASDSSVEEHRWLSGGATIREALQRHGVDCGPADGEILWHALHNVSLDHFNIRLVSDAALTLAGLNSRGYRMGIVTGRPLSASIVARELRCQAVPDVFEIIITSGEIGYRKPHRAVLQSALDRLALAPAEVAVIGDSYEEDIVPASELGMVPVLKLNDCGPDPSWTLARFQVPTLAVLLELEIFRR